MRFFISSTTFISVISRDNYYSCQIMELVHGMGMYPASLLEEDLSDVISCICDSAIFSKHNTICSTLEEVALFHQQCITEHLM